MDKFSAMMWPTPAPAMRAETLAIFAVYEHQHLRSFESCQGFAGNLSPNHAAYADA
jgi:hypothetical protein